jgi:hypothetical protein
VVVVAVGLFTLKIAGTTLPERVSEHPRVVPLTLLVPIALISSVTTSQAFTTGTRVVLDARAAGLAAAAIALLAKAPFIVVVLVAAATAAALRAMT